MAFSIGGNVLPKSPPTTKGPVHGAPSVPRRATAASRGYNHRWVKFRKRYLARSPLCQHCLAKGRTTVATDIDHILPMNDGGSQYDEANLQPLCHSCHSRKTAQDVRARRNALAKGIPYG